MKVAIILPNILLTGKSGNFREKIVENNCLDGVISISRELFPDTGATTSCWVLNNHKKDKLVDFANSFSKEPKTVDTNKIKRFDCLFLPSLYTYEDEPTENSEDLKAKIKQIAGELLESWEEIQKQGAEVKKILDELVKTGQIK